MVPYGCRAGASGSVHNPKRAAPLSNASSAAVVGNNVRSASRGQKACCNPDFCNPAEPSQGPKDEEESGQRVRPIEKDDSAFGPRGGLKGVPPYKIGLGLLLAGFNEEDSNKTIEWMQEMEPDFKVSHVVDGMVNEPLGDALYSSDSQEMRVEAWQQTRTLCPRICIMSGLTGEEQIAIAQSWEDFAGSPAPFFAAAVPNSLGENLKVILQAIVDENANQMEDDPRLDPSHFLSTVDMAKLRAQIEQKLREKGVEAPAEKKEKAQGSDGAASSAETGAACTQFKGFG